MIQVTEIAAKETYLIRQIILRPGKPIESCVFEGDDLPTSKHFGLFVNKELVGIVSVFENKNTIFTHSNQLQVRGMAVLQNYQKKGYGNVLIEKVEAYAKSMKSPNIWFNAREIAVGFYKKLGYTIIGNPFEIGEIGTHYIMHKQL
jgi:GNAT superfamily N-acetyltransferase